MLTPEELKALVEKAEICECGNKDNWTQNQSGTIVCEKCKTKRMSNWFANEVPLSNVRISFNSQKSYRVDFTKVTTLEDIKVVLAAFEIRVNESSPHFEKMKSFLKEEVE